MHRMRLPQLHLKNINIGHCPIEREMTPTKTPSNKYDKKKRARSVFAMEVPFSIKQIIDQQEFFSKPIHLEQKQHKSIAQRHSPNRSARKMATKLPINDQPAKEVETPAVKRIVKKQKKAPDYRKQISKLLEQLLPLKGTLVKYLLQKLDRQNKLTQKLSRDLVKLALLMDSEKYSTDEKIHILQSKSKQLELEVGKEYRQILVLHFGRTNCELEEQLRHQVLQLFV